MRVPDAFRWGGRIGRLRYLAYLAASTAFATTATGALALLPSACSGFVSVGLAATWFSFTYLSTAFAVRRARDMGFSAKASMVVFVGVGFACMALDGGKGSLAKAWYAAFVLILASWPGIARSRGEPVDAVRNDATKVA